MTINRPENPDSNRRGLLAGVGAIITAGIAGLTPIATSVLALFDPLRRSNQDRGLVFVTGITGIPDDGTPRKFNIVTDRTDAWTTYPNDPVGAVYLRRTASGQIAALNVVCPHAGCFVGTSPDQSRFECPCHGSFFAFNGEVDDPSSPAPRSMDTLDVEIRNGEEVWVRFVNYRPGRRNKTPVT